MKKEIVTALAWAGGILLLSLAAKVAQRHGYIDSDTMLRMAAMNGVVIVYYGNLVPKAVAPSASARQSARFAGWTLVLSGLVYAGFWAFAPIPLAMTAGTGALAAGVIVTFGYCLQARARARAGA
jgi:hypothetical protein